MSDGASQGITADRAIKTILGGEPSPKRDEGMTPAQMLEYIESAPEPALDYGGAARLLAKRMLSFARAHLDLQALRSLPADDEYQMPPEDGRDFMVRWNEHIITCKGFDTLWKELDGTDRAHVMDEIGPTGFQFGWAYNAVRYCSELPPVGNPAIVTIGL